MDTRGLEIKMLVDLLPYLIKFSTIERRVTTKHIPALAQGKDVVLKNNQPGNFVDRNAWSFLLTKRFWGLEPVFGVVLFKKNRTSGQVTVHTAAMF